MSTKPTPERVTLRLGALRQPLHDHKVISGLSPVQIMRQALAEHLGVEVPEMRSGNPEFGPEFGNGRSNQCTKSAPKQTDNPRN